MKSVFDFWCLQTRGHQTHGQRFLEIHRDIFSNSLLFYRRRISAYLPRCSFFIRDACRLVDSQSWHLQGSGFVVFLEEKIMWHRFNDFCRTWLFPMYIVHINFLLSKSRSYTDQPRCVFERSGLQTFQMRMKVFWEKEEEEGFFACNNGLGNF